MVNYVLILILWWSYSAEFALILPQSNSQFSLPNLKFLMNWKEQINASLCIYSLKFINANHHKYLAFLLYHRIRARAVNIIKNYKLLNLQLFQTCCPDRISSSWPKLRPLSRRRWRPKLKLCSRWPYLAQAAARAEAVRQAAEAVAARQMADAEAARLAAAAVPKWDKLILLC